MRRSACLLVAAVLLFLASPVSADVFSFSTGTPDGRLAAASRIPSPGLIEIEAGDDFITTANQTTITSASFWGLLTGSTGLGNIAQVDVEIYRVFPKDSDVGRTSGPPTFSTPNVPTRVNSPSDDAFAVRDSGVAGQLSFTVTNLGAFAAANSVVNGIHPMPNQTTGGEGPVSGTQVRFDVTFTLPFGLPPDHYFFVPQVLLSNGSTFLWLSTAGPILFTGDLQAWIRDANLDPDWLRIGTDIIGGATPPRFDMAFSLDGTEVPEPSTLALLLGGLPLLAWRRWRS
jgi:hypothetical protein